MNEIRYYKIRNIKTGLFSRGGSHPSWGKNGKIWKRIGDLNSHFTLVDNYDVYRDAEVIEIVMIETEVNVFPASEFIQASKDRMAESQRQTEIRVAAWRLETAQREVDRLQQIIKNGGK